MRAITALRILLYCGLTVPAAAQSTFAGVKVKHHATLYVTEKNSRETKGKLVSLTDEAMTLQLKDAIRSFTPDELVLVERRGDSLKNGAIVGAMLGSLCAFLTCAMELTGGRLAGAAFEAAALPVGIDAINRGRTRIWPIKQVSRIK
jgi:hypothetical protein